MDSAQIRRIVWLDSSSHSGWHDPTKQEYVPLTAVTVGHCITETDDSITISASVIFGDEYQVADSMTIPKVAILSDEELTTNPERETP